MIDVDRRLLMGGLGAGVAGLVMPAIVRAQALPPLKPATAFQPEGPFYPYDDMPRDHDADLVRVSGLDAQALGQVTLLTGAVWSQFGEPLSGALVEIWQCDNNGRYIHREDPSVERPRDPRFQGYGRMLTDPRGAFRFRTIKPVSYSATIDGREVWRAPHIHAAISTRGVRRLTTQLYVAGEPRNDTDFLLNGMASAAQREGIVRPYRPASGETGVLAAHYDLVVAI